MGHKVEWFSASFPGAPATEELDGIHMVRAGRQWTVHWHAFNRYRGALRGRFDAVIDEVNTIPCFTPLWAGVPHFMLIFQLAREVWWYESPFPLSAIGYATEPMYLKRYRATPVLTISRSTERDLRNLGFKASITVIPIGIDKAPPISMPKADTPTFVYVGRLTPSKRIAHMVRALAHFRSRTGTGTLWLVGSGPERYQRSLSTLARHLGVEHYVLFIGRATSEEKHRRMTEAHALLMTSVREGWGLVVTEANACGTPAIVYDVPGLRDAVRNEQSGLVVRPRPLDLTDAMVRVTTDPNFYASLATECRRWSASFSHERAAQLVAAALERTVAA
jgi:glycosyltransferase involved in cell wall biosynthesis